MVLVCITRIIFRIKSLKSIQKSGGPVYCRKNHLYYSFSRLIKKKGVIIWIAYYYYFHVSITIPFINRSDAFCIHTWLIYNHIYYRFIHTWKKKDPSLFVRIRWHTELGYFLYFYYWKFEFEHSFFCLPKEWRFLGNWRASSRNLMITLRVWVSQNKHGNDMNFSLHPLIIIIIVTSEHCLMKLYAYFNWNSVGSWPKQRHTIK